MVRYMDNNASGFAAWNAARNSAINEKKSAGRSKIASFLWWFIIFVGTWWLITNWTSPRPTPTPSEADAAFIAMDTATVPVNELKSDKISVNVRGTRLSDIELKDFTKSVDRPNDGNVTLLASDDGFAEVGLKTIGTPAPDAKTIWRNVDGKMVWKNSDGVVFTRAIDINGYLVTVTDTVENKTKHEIAIAPYVKMLRTSTGEKTNVASGAIVNANSKIKYVDWNSMNKGTAAFATTDGFSGFADQYWATIAHISSPDQNIGARSIDKKYVVDSVAGERVVAPSDTGVFTTTIFAGPRDQRILDAAATTISGIDEAVDYGWFWFFARPLLWILNSLNALVMNYGVAIIILTILLRLAMWPLTRKSYKSSITMQQMQPEMQRIQKLYANDKARLQIEMINLYKTHKTSPMSGCLPMLIQIPIFFALYKALLVSVQMRNAGFLWIHDLAAKDPYYILPILMGATMWLQQYLQSPHTKNIDKNNPMAGATRFMKWMPLIFTVMFAWVPAGLVLYWTVSNIFGIVQTYIIKRELQKK